MAQQQTVGNQMSVDLGFILKQRLVSQKRVSYIKRLIEVKVETNNVR